jgi:hypothetical protein
LVPRQRDREHPVPLVRSGRIDPLDIFDRCDDGVVCIQYVCPALRKPLSHARDRLVKI